MIMLLLKLNSTLDILQSDKIERHCRINDLKLIDDDLANVKCCFSESSLLIDEERSTLHYISGYVAYKEGQGIATPENPTDNTESEFLTEAPREKPS